MQSTGAFAHPNIAFVKYWGNRDPQLNIPLNGSISMNLDGLVSETRVRFDSSLAQDELWLNGQLANRSAVQRAGGLLDRVRSMSGIREFALIESRNNFPTGVGIASSASGYAALALAASFAAGMDLSEADLSRLARASSGSACRSVPGGFVEWQAGEDDRSSYAFTIATPDHWRLVDIIAVISKDHKTVSSQQGHAMANTSPLQPGRLANVKNRLRTCRDAILNRDFEALASVTEMESNLMHAVMMTSTPALLYWLPETIFIMREVIKWRAKGIPLCYTIDAGPNVHVICQADAAQDVISWLKEIEKVHQVFTAYPGGPARLTKLSSPYPAKPSFTDESGSAVG